MQRKRNLTARLWLAGFLVATCFFVAPALGGGLLDHWKGEPDCPESGPVTVRQLAKLVDDLDREMFRDGMIAVKAPDVWGQNRMTKYRSEFELEMAKEVEHFKYMLNGAMRTSDVAVLTSATSIGAGLAPGAGPAAPAAAVKLPTLPAGVPPAISDAVSQLPAAIQSVEALASSAPAGTAPAAPTSASGDPSSLLSDIANRLDKLQAGVAQLPKNIASDIRLEPTLQLDEHARYLYHLQELRRINVGDDLTDLPGYGLYLIRMPVSLLPGAEVRKGKGAEVTVEARHELTPDLLANTFRDVVIMDTAYQINGILIKVLHGAVELPCSPAAGPSGQAIGRGKGAPADRGVTRSVFQGIAQPTPRHGVSGSFSAMPISTSGIATSIGQSESLDLYGCELAVLADAVWEDRKDWYAHDPSVLSWLLAELGATHRFMREQARNGAYAFMFQDDWFRTFDDLIQRRDWQGLAVKRTEYINGLVKIRNGIVNADQAALDALKRPPDVLAYALMIQSVIVNRQLRHDMDVMCQRRGCQVGDLATLTFYDLFPSEEAKQAFNIYVQCKWPIHIFTLDPVVEQQNLLDAYSARSELQLALAFALSTGQVNVNNATKFARQLDTDLYTIALNRTAVGFGAGETTFGWRFFPRVQSPPPQNNLARITGILVNGGPGGDYLERNRKIEPGLRECVALVVVPNFVPSVHLTTTANWFDLTGHHADQKYRNRDYLALSRMLQRAHNALGRVCDAGQYRPGELGRLARRINQLEALLPIQDHRVNLPDEGDLTGSEIFASNSAGLAPRLLTWYGEFPREGTNSQIFLVGTGFSVLETQVIAGGVQAASLRQLSRNVLEITVADKARPVEINVPDRRHKVFDIHVATPNGVSNHLLVQADDAEKGDGPKPVTTTVTTTTTTGPNSSTTMTQITTTPPGIVLPQGTVLPLGTALPPNTTISPNGGPTNGGTVPPKPATTPAAPAGAAAGPTTHMTVIPPPVRPPAGPDEIVPPAPVARPRVPRTPPPTPQDRPGPSPPTSASPFRLDPPPAAPQPEPPPGAGKATLRLPAGRNTRPTDSAGSNRSASLVARASQPAARAASGDAGVSLLSILLNRGQPTGARGGAGSTLQPTLGNP